MENQINENVRARRSVSSLLSEAKANKSSNEESMIAQKVKAIIVDKLNVNASEVTYNASFANDLGADSLDTVELIMEFEKAFGINIPDNRAERISTVGEAISYIEAALR